MKPTVIVISGAAPYLGGAETWRPLREAAPDVDFIAIDPLDFVRFSDLDAALHASVREYLPTADAIVGHFNADRAIVELVVRERPGLPIVLVSPCTMYSNARRVRIVSRVVDRPWFGNLIAMFARGKLRKLRASRDSVVKQLSSFVGASFLDGPLVDEAHARIRDERTSIAVARTTDLLREMMRPVSGDARAYARLTVLVGSSLMDRRTARRTQATVIPGVVAAAMIEAPDMVAAILRDVVGLARRGAP